MCQKRKKMQKRYYISVILLTFAMLIDKNRKLWIGVNYC